MEKVLVIYGGKSVESDISIITGLQAMSAIKDEFDILPVYIDRDGGWWTCKNALDPNIYADFLALAEKPRKLFLDFEQKSLRYKKGWRYFSFKPDAALVCLHGTNGEDGAIAGTLQMADIAFSCPSLASSAVCFDKQLTKIVLSHWGLPVVDGVCMQADEVDKTGLFSQLSFPIIVKPARLGSSVGIAVCYNEEELDLAIEAAKIYDKKLIFERYIQKRREFNCAVMKFGKRISISTPQEVKSKKFYSFDEKYLKASPSAVAVKSKKLAAQIQKLCENVVTCLECEGVVRVDLFIENDRFFVGEVNTVPGSLSGYLFGSLKEVAIELVEGAMQRRSEAEKLSSSFSSSALGVFQTSIDLNKYTKK